MVEQASRGHLGKWTDHFDTRLAQGGGQRSPPFQQTHNDLEPLPIDEWQGSDEVHLRAPDYKAGNQDKHLNRAMGGHRGRRTRQEPTSALVDIHLRNPTPTPRPRPRPFSRLARGPRDFQVDRIRRVRRTADTTLLHQDVRMPTGSSTCWVVIKTRVDEGGANRSACDARRLIGKIE